MNGSRVTVMQVKGQAAAAEPQWKVGDGKPCTTCGKPAYWLPYVGGDDDPARVHIDNSGWADNLCEARCTSKVKDLPKRTRRSRRRNGRSRRRHE